MDKNTQMKKLLRLFLARETVTVRQISDILDFNSPRKVISDLRSKGVPIESRYVEEINLDNEIKRFKEYWIPKDLKKEWEDVDNVL